ncbi:hypothetical protein [Mucilaginibacter kameinonensis]|uniref:hypothetical protein n=1 Tax=Mucilaginibacter kameinonensis TaxID=452286 RepID=UPI000EF8060D|nr:hypothetical protein [Mucilaginibacter kameinonensis]
MKNQQEHSCKDGQQGQQAEQVFQPGGQPPLFVGGKYLQARDPTAVKPAPADDIPDGETYSDEYTSLFVRGDEFHDNKY